MTVANSFLFIVFFIHSFSIYDCKDKKQFLILLS